MPNPKTQATPGPWRVMEGDVYCEGAVPGPDHAIAHVYGVFEEEREANARLIAAAPQMREALEAVTKWLEEYAGLTDPDDMETVRKSIATARAALHAAGDEE